MKEKQDGRLPPAYFSHECKLFDQHLPTVKKETTVQNVVYEGFLQTSIPPLTSIFYAKEGVSRFSVKNFRSHSTEKFVREPLCISKKFFYRKFSCIGGRGHHGFAESFFVSQCRKISWGSLRCFRKFRASKNFLHKKGVSRISVENFRSHSTKKYLWETLRCFRKFLLSKISMHRGGGITVSSKIFCLTGPKRKAL